MSELPEAPQNDFETYLAILAGQDLDIPDHEVTSRAEAYLRYICEHLPQNPVLNVDGRSGAVLTYRAFEYGSTVSDPQTEFEDALAKMQRIMCIYVDDTLGELDLPYQGYSSEDRGWVFASIVGNKAHKVICSNAVGTVGQWRHEELSFITS